MQMLMAFMHCDSQDLWGSIIGAFNVCRLCLRPAEAIIAWVHVLPRQHWLHFFKMEPIRCEPFPEFTFQASGFC